MTMVTSDAIEQAMRMSGMSVARAADAAGTFGALFTAVGILFAIGNAIGILAYRGRAWVFWVALVTNLIQGLGALFGMVPPEVFRVVENEYGLVATLPSRVTDWGGLALATVLIVSLVVFRAPWAHRRSPRRSSGESGERPAPASG